MTVKKTWPIEVAHIGRLPVHQYDGSVCTGVEQMVQVVGVVTSGPQKDREVRLTMTVQEAEAFAARVLLARDAAAYAERDR